MSSRFLVSHVIGIALLPQLALAEHPICERLGLSVSKQSETTERSGGIILPRLTVGIESRTLNESAQQYDAASIYRSASPCSQCLITSECLHKADSFCDASCGRAQKVSSAPVGEALPIAWAIARPPIRQPQPVQRENGPHPKPRNVPGLPFVLQNAAGWCLDYREAPYRTDDQISTTPCDRPQSQTWTLDGLQLRNNQGYCLDAYTGQAGSSLVLRDCKAARAAWWLTSKGPLMFNSRCIQTVGNTKVRVGACADAQSTIWTKISTTSG